MWLEAAYEHLGNIANVASVAAGIMCGAYMQVITRERVAGVHIQRCVLGIMAVCLVANGFASWMPIEGRRPTGALVDVMILVNFGVMAWRGGIVPSMRPSRVPAGRPRPD